MTTVINSPIISHLIFVDDLLLFGKANVKQMDFVNEILKNFYDKSGQRINKNKTKIFFLQNIAKHIKRQLVHAYGFSETKDLGKYLGNPLSGRNPKRRDYQHIIDQVKSKKEAQKSDHLSFIGKITLAKAVIKTIPTYYMMMSTLSKASLKEIQKVQRDFIWGDS